MTDIDKQSSLLRYRNNYDCKIYYRTHPKGLCCKAFHNCNFLYRNKLECFHRQSLPPKSNIFRQGWSLLKWSPMQDLTLIGILPALPRNIRLGWKWLTDKDSSLLRYGKNIAVKSFIVQAPGSGIRSKERQSDNDNRWTKGATTSIILTLSIMTFSVTVRNCDIQHNETQHNDTLCLGRVSQCRVSLYWVSQMSLLCWMPFC